jgi:hypothetical protein
VRAADETLQEDIGNALLDVSSVRVCLVCSFTIPLPGPGEQLDPTQALFLVRAHDGTTTEVPRVDGVEDCAGSPWGGWYYDDPATPQEITVCPCTCEGLDVDGLEIRIGCTE